MPMILGGEKAWKVYSKGDLVVAFHWLNEEPAMFIYPKNASSMQRTAFVIPIESAFKYANANGYPTPYAAQMAHKCAEVLGLFPDRFLVTRIMDVIMEGIVDLIEMPPEPVGLNAQDTQAVGELLVKVDGQTRVHAEINAANELIRP